MDLLRVQWFGGYELRSGRRRRMKRDLRFDGTRWSWLATVWVVACLWGLVGIRARAQCSAGCLGRIAELERSIAADESTLRSLAGSGTQVIVGDGSGPGLADSYRKSIAAKRNAIQLYRQQHARCGASGTGVGGPGVNAGNGLGLPLPSAGNADQAARIVETVGGLIGAFQQLQEQKERAQEAREERERQRKREEQAEKEEAEYRASIRAAVAQEEQRIRELHELARRRSGVRYGDGLWIYRSDKTPSDDLLSGKPSAGGSWAREDRFGPQGQHDVSWLLMDSGKSPRQEVFPGRGGAAVNAAGSNRALEDWLTNNPVSPRSGSVPQGTTFPPTRPSPQANPSTPSGRPTQAIAGTNSDSSDDGLDTQPVRQILEEVIGETLGQLMDQAAAGEGVRFREAISEAAREVVRQRMLDAAMEYARRQPVLPEGKRYEDLPLETRLQAESLSALWDYGNQLLQRNWRGAADAFDAYCNRGLGAGFQHFLESEGGSSGK